MELWIRSQDKMLLARAVDIRIVIEQEGASIIDDTTTYILGMYKSEERALEVLNEIQKILEPQEYIVWDKRFRTGHSTYNISSYVYEMPSE